VVLYTNPRGTTSHGEEFENLAHHAYPEAMPQVGRVGKASRFITFLRVVQPIANRVAVVTRELLKGTLQPTGPSGGTLEPGKGFACRVRQLSNLAAHLSSLLCL
jgi:hypothetical protein